MNDFDRLISIGAADTMPATASYFPRAKIMALPKLEPSNEIEEDGRWSDDDHPTTEPDIEIEIGKKKANDTLTETAPATNKATKPSDDEMTKALEAAAKYKAKPSTIKLVQDLSIESKETANV